MREMLEMIFRVDFKSARAHVDGGKGQELRAAFAN